MGFKKSSKNYHQTANWSEQHRFAAEVNNSNLQMLSAAKANTLINQMHSYRKQHSD
jgi:hypothetical protein